MSYVAYLLIISSRQAWSTRRRRSSGGTRPRSEARSTPGTSAWLSLSLSISLDLSQSLKLSQSLNLSISQSLNISISQSLNLSSLLPSSLLPLPGPAPVSHHLPMMYTCAYAGIRTIRITYPSRPPHAYTETPCMMHVWSEQLSWISVPSTTLQLANSTSPRVEPYYRRATLFVAANQTDRAPTVRVLHSSCGLLGPLLLGAPCL